MTALEIQNILKTVTPEVVDQEAVYGGYRPKERRYVHDQGVLVEKILYKFPAASDSWAAIVSISFEEGSIDELPVFRSWNISDHPVYPGVFRRVDLIEMKIDAPTIKLVVAVKHFSDQERTEGAPYAPLLMPMVAANDTIIDVPQELQSQGAPAQMGEREYWHFLTGLGMTPYQLLDARIPELDQIGRFENIY